MDEYSQDNIHTTAPQHYQVITTGV